MTVRIALIVLLVANAARAEQSDSSVPARLPPAAVESESTTSSNAPRQIRQWFIDGELEDPQETLRAFLSPILEGANWSTGLAEDRLKPLLERLGYHGVARTRDLNDGGVSLVVTIEPITTIRYIRVKIAASALARLREALFADEILRRMTLRRGSRLERNLDARKRQLRSEADRLARYLRNDGFFDATVKIEERPVDAHTARIDVKVSPGPPYRIGKLNVVGNTAINEGDIVEKFHHGKICIGFCVGTARFTRSRLNRDLDRVAEMYKKRGYPGVKVTSNFDPAHSFKRDTKTVEFTVQVRERRKIDIVFESKKKFKSEKLMENLTLAADGSYDDVALEESAASLRRYLQSRGYFEASVSWQRIRYGVFDRVFFRITTGPKLKVKRISFGGNQAVSSNRLRNAINTREYRRIIIGESGGYATTAQLAKDAERIRAAYAQRGFADAQVEIRVSRSGRDDSNAAALAAAVATGRRAAGLYVHFEIDEGPYLIVQEVRIDYLDKRSIPAPILLKNTSLRAGRAFRASEADEDARRVRSEYFRRGYPRAKVVPYWERANKGRVILHFRVSEGTTAKIGENLVRGNYKTRDWVIREEMNLVEGQTMTSDRTEQAQANLRRSGLFSAVKIDYLGADDPRKPAVNVLVNVEEANDVPLYVTTGGGYSTDSRFFAEAGANVPNIGGTGAIFDVQGQLGQEIQSVQTGLTLPRWIMRHAVGSAFSWNLNGFIRRQDTVRFGALESVGGSVAASKQGTSGLFKGWLFSLRYDYRRRNRDEELVRPAGRSADVSRSPVRTTVSSVGPVLTIDRRKDRLGQRNPLAPASGWLLELRSAFAEDAVLGSNRFIKIGASGQHFWSFGQRFRLSNAVRYDQGVPLGGDVLIPEVERFYAGGDVTVRGFEEDRLGTEVIEQELPPASGVTQFRVLPAGGNIRFIYNLELELITYRWSRLSLASAVFTDTGLIKNSLVGFRVADLRHSLGIALMRIVSPIGSLSFEWAIPLDPEIGDNPRGRTHINFGFLF